MLTAHAILRDRYRRYAAVLEVSIFCATAILLMVSLADASVFSTLQLNAERARISIAVLAVVAAVLAFIQTLVDWKERSGEHARTVITLSKLKTRCRELRDWPVDEHDRDVQEWFRESDDILTTIPPLPDDKFGTLKAKHKRKVKVSQLLDRYPALPVPFLRMVLLWRDLKALRRGDQAEAP